jgi:Putative regulator of cell autolysis
MKQLRPWLNSLRVKLFVIILLIVAPLIVIITINDYYSVHVVRNQVAQSNKNLLSLYMNQIDSNLIDIDNYLFNVSEGNTDLLQFEYPGNKGSAQYSLAKIRLFNEMKNEIEYYRSIDMFFLYSESNDDILLAGSSDYGTTYDSREQVQNEVRKLLSTDLSRIDYEKWHVWEAADGEYYLYHVVKTGSVYVGAWVAADKLMTPLHLMDFGEEGGALLATRELEPMQLRDKVEAERIDLHYDSSTFEIAGEKKAYLVMGEASAKGDFHLIALIPETAILQKLPYLQRISSLVTIAACVFLVLFFFVMRKVFLLPIQRIISAMRKLKDGNWQSALKPYATSTEFEVMNQTYNHMIDEIRNLKINVYEEKLNHQRAELKHLQLQINPHFFLNSLNIIYNLATVKDYSLIQEMTKCLVAYFRFMFRSNTYFVSLKDELEHTRNYLRIQQLRFPGHLAYRIEADPELLKYDIPPLVIQTIVENSIKYAVSMDGVLEVYIRVHSDAARDPGKLFVEIGDSGPGYPEEVLLKLRSNEESISEEGENVGIWNIKRRLELLYKQEAFIAFGNAPEGGARAEIGLPLEQKEG